MITSKKDLRKMLRQGKEIICLDNIAYINALQVAIELGFANIGKVTKSF